MSISDFTYIGIRGWDHGWRSIGIDRLASELNQLGLNGYVIDAADALDQGDILAKSSGTENIIVFGYGRGATHAVYLSSELIEKGFRVPLLFTISPHLPLKQISGVDRHINFWMDRLSSRDRPIFEVQKQDQAKGYLENIPGTVPTTRTFLDETKLVIDHFQLEVEDLLTRPENPTSRTNRTNTLEPAWILDVNKHLDLHEVHDNQALSEYLLSDGSTLGDPAKNPWCGDLVETAFQNTLPDEPIPVNPYWARNWQKFGIACDPQPYCLLVFKRGDGGHVGFYIGETDTHYIVRGGNQSNRITDSKYRKSELLASRWPKTADKVIDASEFSNKDKADAAFHKAFFDYVREPLFQGRMSQGQVDGMKTTLSAWFETTLNDNRWLAYMLATCWLETDRTMQAISEYGDRSYFTRMYDIKGARPDKARELGNIHPGDGAKYHGRGKPMLTGRSNYQKADKNIGHRINGSFEDTPSLVLVGNHSDLIMISGMTNGWYTGKKLSDYFNENTDDPIGARRIVNGSDRADEIAKAHYEFLNAIELGYAAREKRQANPIFPETDIEIEILPQPVQDMTSKELLDLMSKYLTELATRERLNFDRSIAPSGQMDVSFTTNRPIPSSKKGTSIMKPVDGLKTYITMAIVAAIAVAEGVLDIDVPGAEMQANWVEYILGAAGVGSIRHAIAKVIRGVIR